LSEIQHRQGKFRGFFFIGEDGKRVAAMTYSRVGTHIINIDHTEVDEAHSGQGLGRRLLDALVAWARESGTRVTATCPYASAQFARDPTIRDVLAT